MSIAAFDFDGTLFFNGSVDPKVVRAIQDFRAAGNIVIACTGRSRSATQLALAGSGLDFDFHVMNTGASVSNRDHEIIHDHHLDPELVDFVLEHLASVDGAIAFATTLDGKDAIIDQEEVPDLSILNDFRPMTRAEVRELSVVGVPIWVPDNPALMQEILDWVASNVDAGVTSNLDFIDITPKNTTKGNGITWLVEQFGWAGQKLYTFGDSFNDLSMHELADVSFSFPHSPQAVQDATTHVVADVAEGISLLLRDACSDTHRG